MVSRPASRGAAADRWIAVFDVVAFADVLVIVPVVFGRQDLQQIGAGPLFRDGARRPYEGLVDPGDPCRVARRDLAMRE